MTEWLHLKLDTELRMLPSKKEEKSEVFPLSSAKLEIPPPMEEIPFDELFTGNIPIINPKLTQDMKLSRMPKIRRILEEFAMKSEGRIIARIHWKEGLESIRTQLIRVQRDFSRALEYIDQVIAPKNDTRKVREAMNLAIRVHQSMIGKIEAEIRKYEEFEENKASLPNIDEMLGM